ncbi:MAG: fibronectin type III domain-containing protein, partial [Betaproteobacteria bacterium]
DTTPPTTPTGLTAAAVGLTGANLSWSASTDNVAVTGYIVRRNGVQVATPTTTSFADTGLSAATTYSYTVAARDAAGNLSPDSASVSVTTAIATDTTPPTTPTGLTAAAAGSTGANLSWSASTDNVGVT